jgi:hypothetical protein
VRRYVDDHQANLVTSAGIDHVPQVARAEMDHHRLLDLARTD